MSTSSDNESQHFNYTFAEQKRNHRGKGRRQGSYLKISKPIIYLFLAIIFVLFVMVAIDLKLKLEARYNLHGKASHTSAHHGWGGHKSCNGIVYCDNALETATKGYWVKQENKVLSPWEQHDVKAVRKLMKLPTNMSRDDYKCGLEFPIAHTRLAAHCNPDSETLKFSCCNEETGWCGKTDEHCNDALSLNMKNIIPEANAKWIVTNDTKCNLKAFTTEEACHILSKTVNKIIFLGDSQARRFFTSFLLLLTNNYQDGAIKGEYKTNKYTMTSCEGDYQVLNNDCRKYLITTSTEAKQICSGTDHDFELEYFADFRSYVTKSTSDKYESLYDKEKTFIVVGAGTHFNSDHVGYLHHYLKYIVTQKGDRAWPHFIAETLHDVYSRVSNQKRHEFNQAVKAYAEGTNIDLFDNSALSSMLESYDGRTHGLKFQMLKVDILLHYFYNMDLCR